MAGLESVSIQIRKCRVGDKTATERVLMLSNILLKVSSYLTPSLLICDQNSREFQNSSNFRD